MFDDQVEQPVQEEVAQNEQSVDESAQDPQKQAQAQPSKEDNMRALREKAERLERERDEYARYVQQIQMAQQQYQQQPQQTQEEQELNPGDEDLLEGKHFRQMKKKYQELEKKYVQMEEKAYASVVEARIRSQFTDWDAVVNEYTVKALRESEPELAASLHANPDVLSKSVATYKAIKRLGLNQTNAYDHEKDLAQRNAAKPRTLTSIAPQQGDTPLSRANAFASGLTDELRTQLRKEMEEARKKY